MESPFRLGLGTINIAPLWNDRYLPYNLLCKKKWYIWAQAPATGLGFPKYMRSTHWPRVNHGRECKMESLFRLGLETINIAPL